MAGESINDLERQFYQGALEGTLPGGGVAPINAYGIVQASITHPDPAYTIAVTGTGDNDLNPANGGYVTALNGYSEALNEGSKFTVLADGRVRVEQDGVVKAVAYADVEHSANNATVGAAFSIERGVSTILTPRAVHSKVPNTGDVGSLSGTGSFTAVAGDILGIALASDITGSISIRASSLVVEYVGDYS